MSDTRPRWLYPVIAAAVLVLALAAAGIAFALNRPDAAPAAGSVTVPDAVVPLASPPTAKDAGARTACQLVRDAMTTGKLLDRATMTEVLAAALRSPGVDLMIDAQLLYDRQGTAIAAQGRSDEARLTAALEDQALEFRAECTRFGLG